MTLALIDIINGILLLIIITISICVAVRLISLYFKKKERVYLYSGITWIALVSPWYAHCTAFIVTLFTGKGISAELYFILGNILIPIGLIAWTTAFTELFYKKFQKIVLCITIFYAILFYILFFIALSTNPNLIGELQGDIEVQYSRVVIIYYLTLLTTILITGVFFGLRSMKSDNPEIKLRGILIIVAFISYVIGIAVDAIIEHTILTLIFIRLVELSSAIEFYTAFIMPNIIKKHLLNNK